MKEYLAAQVRMNDPLAGRHVIREVLQAKVLSSLQRAGAMIPLAFHGGTALRFLFSINRFSEDLDFALERADRGYDAQMQIAGKRLAAGGGQLHHVLGIAQQHAPALGDLTAQLCHHHRSFGALGKLGAEHRLKLLDACTQCRGRHIARLRGPVEMLLIGKGVFGLMSQDAG